MNGARAHSRRGFPPVVLAALALAATLLVSGCVGASSAPARVVVSTNGVITAVAD